MLRPAANARRDRRKLDGIWWFAVDRHGEGHDRQWWRGRLPGAVEVPVPASYNDVFADAATRDHVGEVWYQTSVRVPRSWDGERIALRFDAAAHRAVAWVGETRVVEHEGGYTPFEADVTDVVAVGAENRVTVAVDNRLSWETIPPGHVEQTPDGPRQRYHHDFFNYAGLHRSVWLHTTPKARIDDVTAVTGLDGTTGTVDYEVVTAGGADDLAVRTVLRDADGTVVAENSHAAGKSWDTAGQSWDTAGKDWDTAGTNWGAAGTLRVEDVNPWRPGEGYLYELDVQLLDASGSVADEYSLNVGIRTVQVRGTEFLINGEPFHFTGFGMHEDHPVRGKGHDDASVINDFALLAWTGANSLRTSHYPYAEEVLDHADRNGIVVIDETAAVGLNLGVGGGILGTASGPTYSEDTIGEATRRAHSRAIRELVARDKNHPSVVLWSIANEPESGTAAAREYFEPLFAETRRLDPSRPVGFVNVMLAPADTCLLAELSDVLMLNRYYGWYLDPGDLAAAERGLQDELTAWTDRYAKPIIMTEYGADAVAGMHAVASQPWTEEYQAELLDTYHRVFDRFEAVVGEQVWNFADFATAAGFARVEGNKKGVFTRDRRPKAAAFALRRRWRGES